MSNTAKIIRIAEGRKSLGRVTDKNTGWGLLCERLTTRRATAESLKQYMALPKEEQDALKNVNGYWIGGHCKDGKRSKKTIGPRDVLTLDLDNLTPALFAKLKANLTALKNFEHVIHTTRKHKPDAPRCRVVVLLKRPILTDEYEAVGRLVAFAIDHTMEAVDDVSFRPAQMMYWPSCSKDSEFVAHRFEGKPLDPDALFANWRKKGKDPHDYRDLPFSESQGQKRKTAALAEDPWDKEGIVGAFCRTYPIEEAIAEFLSDFYAPGDMDGPKPRYTYLGGTTTNGVEIQDDGRFMYSHHTSDPLSDMLVNSFDAVRICLYGDLDEGAKEGTAIGNMPSFKKMAEVASRIPAVTKDLTERRYGFEARMVESFADLSEEDEDGDTEDRTPTPPTPARERAPKQTTKLSAEDLELLGEIAPVSADAAPAGDVTDAFDALEDEEDDAPPPVTGTKTPPKPGADRPPEGWLNTLDRDKNGIVQPTVYNITALIQNDSRMFRRFAFNEMLGQEVLFHKMTNTQTFGLDIPVTDRENGDRVEDYLVTHVQRILEASPENGGYGLKAPKGMVNDALNYVARSSRFHPVKIMLDKNPWDGVKRLETVLPRYFKADDNAYTRAAFKLFMVAAVARTYEPGHKFDFCLIIQGAQGIGKSSFFQALGRGAWYAVFDCGFDDTKAAVEKMAGKVILEIGEMSSYHKSDLDAAKQFLSTQKDVVRLSYDKRGSEHPRKGVFCGTVNGQQFLRDLTGNRRMWPVSANLPANCPIDFAAFEAEVVQLWAEAKAIYDQMRARKPQRLGDLHLDLTGEASTIAAAAQERAQIETEIELWRDELAHWLDRPIMSTDLVDPSVVDRFDDLDASPKHAIQMRRAVVNAKTAWTEGLKRELRDLTGKNAHTLREAMNLLQGWSWAQGKHAINGDPPSRVMVLDGTVGAPPALFVPYGDDADLLG